MKPKMETCRLIKRRIAGQRLAETAQPVATLEEVFASCLSKTEPQIVDRLVIAGHDAQGRARLITFTFKSVVDQDILPTAAADNQTASD